MNRRDFMGTSVGACLAASGVASRIEAAAASDQSCLASPLDTKLAVRPVMTNMVHTGVWEGPCRWNAVSVSDEKRHAEASFAGWSTQIGQQLGGVTQQSRLELLDRRGQLRCHLAVRSRAPRRRVDCR